MTTNKRMVELDAVLDKIKSWETLTYNCDSFEDGFELIADEIQALPSIPNPIEIVEEMIDIELETESIKEERLRCLEDVLGIIKGEPPSRHNIT